MNVRDIAKIAGVSPATISLVINNRQGVSKEKREKIQKLLSEVGYYSKKQKTKKNNQHLLFLKIVKEGFLVEQNAGFIAKIMDSIQKECSKKNYALQVQLINKNYKEEINKIDFSEFEGIFVVGTELTQIDYHALDTIKIPYIVIDNSMPYYSCSSITMNNMEMVFQSIKYLCTSGITDFGYFRSTFDSQNFLERNEGVQKAIKVFNLEYSIKKEFRLEATLKGSYEGMLKYLDEGRKIPKIVFADNDIIAIGAMNALQSRGYKIPSDVSIIGFDDIFLAENSIPPLSTMHVQRTMIGKMAAINLINEIKCKAPSYSKTTVGGSLKIRKSTL